MARAQWIAIGLVAAAAVALTAALVFAILTITRPGDQRVATPAATLAASPTPPPPISAIFATSTPAVPPTPGPPPGQAPTTGTLQVGNTGGEGANLRRDPSQSGERIKTIPEGTVLTIVGPDVQADGQTWRNVRDIQGDSGWIVAQYLVPEGTVPPPVAAAPGSSSGTASTAIASTPAPRPTSASTGPAGRGQVGNTGGQGANIRSEPGGGGRVLKTLAEGTNVEVLGPEREVDGRVWRQVRDPQGVTGWIVAGAVVAPGTVPTPAPVINPAATNAPAAGGATATPRPAGAPTSAPAGTTTAPAGPTSPPARPTSTPSGNLPVIIQPATPLPKPGSSPAPGR